MTKQNENKVNLGNSGEQPSFYYQLDLISNSGELGKEVASHVEKAIFSDSDLIIEEATTILEILSNRGVHLLSSESISKYLQFYASCLQDGIKLSLGSSICIISDLIKHAARNGDESTISEQPRN
jgi:hypothetical protein